MDEEYYRMRRRTCKREAEARKWRLNDGSCQVAEMRGVAEWPSTAEIGKSERFRVQRPTHPYSANHVRWYMSLQCWDIDLSMR